jgi:hypothetical protein|tara:strand:- start:5277 stop:6368 length:1092 start_codon:yes stop_codon:yes gene_type:complete
MAIDYNSDIAPLRSQYFPVGGLRDSELRRLRKNYAENIAPLQQKSLELDNNIIRLQQQELAFDRSQFELSEAKRRAKEEADAMARLPQVSQKLDAILADTTKTPYERSKEINSLQREYATAIPESPALKSLFSGAYGSVQLDIDRREREEVSRRRRLGMMYNLGQSGAVEAIKKLAGDEIDEDEQAAIDFGQVYADRHELKTKAEQDAFAVQLAKDKEKNRVNGLKFDLDILSAHQSALSRMGVLSTKGGLSFDKDGNIISYTPSKGISDDDLMNFKFDGKDRTQLKDIYRDLNEQAYERGDEELMSEDEIAKIKTNDLYKNIIRILNKETRRIGKEIYQTPSGTADPAADPAPNSPVDLSTR